MAHKMYLSRVCLLSVLFLILHILYIFQTLFFLFSQSAEIQRVMDIGNSLMSVFETMDVKLYEGHERFLEAHKEFVPAIAAAVAAVPEAEAAGTVVSDMSSSPLVSCSSLLVYTL